jgi:hypothetical protein
MNTQTTFAKVFVTETESDLIRKYKLQKNSEESINEIVLDFVRVRELSRIQSPNEYQSMVEWAKSFQTMYELTNSLNKVRVPELQYLINYSKETNTTGFNLMSQVAFMQLEFQKIFAKYFVRRK